METNQHTIHSISTQNQENFAKSTIHISQSTASPVRASNRETNKEASQITGMQKLKENFAKSTIHISQSTERTTRTSYREPNQRTDQTIGAAMDLICLQIQIFGTKLGENFIKSTNRILMFSVRQEGSRSMDLAVNQDLGRRPWPITDLTQIMVEHRPSTAVTIPH